jgi:hypothetical protein
MDTQATDPNATTTANPMMERQKNLADVEAAFTQVTDGLIALYRTVERRTLDLPVVSFMPLVISTWELLKFLFLLSVGILLIIPVNIIILLRNLFPGRWRYRPFFLSQLYYCWLWMWRGEPPVWPSIFVRPLFSFFVRGHFENRLRRLRLEISLQDLISDATRGALLGRLDAALERWKSPHFTTIALTVLLPGIISVPTWGKQLTDFLVYFGIDLPINVTGSVISALNISRQGVMVVALIALMYLLTVPITALLAKRGLFIGRDPKRIWFPGGQGGDEIYFKEREILASVGLHAREAPADLWITGLYILVFFIYCWELSATSSEQVRFLSRLMGFPYDDPSFRQAFPVLHDAEQRALYQNRVFSIFSSIAMIAALFTAAFRRRKTGRL